MPVSRNKKVTKRGTHSERVKSHDAYLAAKYPNQFNLTSPYSAVVAEMLDDAVMEQLNESDSAEAWREEWEHKIADMKLGPCPAIELAETFRPEEAIEGEVLTEDTKESHLEIQKAVQELLLSGKIAGTE